MLDSQVRVLFLEDGTMTVQCPYNKEFNEALRENSIYRTWNKAERRWYFHGKDAGDICKLLEDYFPGSADSANHSTGIPEPTQ